MKTELKLLRNTAKYRKTKKGVLTNMYHHMKYRHFVEFSLQEFHRIFSENKKYLRLYNDWVKNNYCLQLKPSLDRIDCKKEYIIGNINMMTWAENRYKQSAIDGKRGRKPAVYQILGNKVIKRYQSQRHVVKNLGISQGNLSAVLNGKRNYVNGYKFVYENPELLEAK